MSEWTNISPFGSGDLFFFEEPGDSLECTVLAVREGISFKNGKADVADAATLKDQQPVSFIISAGLKAYDWYKLIGEQVKITFIAEEKSPSTGRNYKKFEVATRK